VKNVAIFRGLTCQNAIYDGCNAIRLLGVTMSRAIGDSVFNRFGQPGVVSQRDSSKGMVTIETKGPQIDDVQKRGYINGLSEGERMRFNSVVDRVRTIEDPVKRVMELQRTIDGIKADPTQATVVKYLESELAHTMISYKIKPREYVTDDTML
jgi:hypothetical protein